MQFPTTVCKDMREFVVTFTLLEISGDISKDILYRLLERLIALRFVLPFDLKIVDPDGMYLGA